MDFRSRLALNSTAAYFDLSTVEGRGASHTLLVDLFFDIASFVRPKVFAEIGAFDATFSRKAKTLFPQSKVFAFEANPHNHKKISEDFDFAGAGIDYRHAAISDRNGHITFQLMTKRGGVEAPRVKGDDSLLKRRHGGVYGEVEYESVEVETARLDTIFHASEFVGDDFMLWIDVEGASQQVFAGAPRVIGQTRAVFIEVEEKSYWSDQWLLNDVDDFLTANGFVAVARDFENAHQFNVLFVKEDLLKHFMMNDRLVSYHFRLGWVGRNGGRL